MLSVSVLPEWAQSNCTRFCFPPLVCLFPSPSFSPHHPRCRLNFFSAFYLPAKFPSSAFAHLSPTPVSAVSFRKGGQNAFASSLSQALSHRVATSHSLLASPLEGQTYTRDTVSWRGWGGEGASIAAHFVFGKLENLLISSILTYIHTLAVGTHSWAHTGIETHCIFCKPVHKCGLLVVSHDNPLITTRWPALTHQCNDLAANHNAM